MEAQAPFPLPRKELHLWIQIKVQGAMVRMMYSQMARQKRADLLRLGMLEQLRVQEDLLLLLGDLK